jgi:hypothetical protein
VVVAFHAATLATGRALPLTRTGLSPVGTRQLSWRTEDRLHRHGVAAEWGDILRDLNRLQEIELEQDGKRFLLRTPTIGVAGKLFQAIGVALPPNVQELPLPASQSPA